MGKLRKVLGKRLAQLMKERQVSVAELAKESGLSRPTIYGYLKSELPAGLDAVEALATALKVSPADLLMDPTERLLGAVEMVKDALSALSLEEILRLVSEIAAKRNV